jgi:ATP:cob(I)alamin adenosyltransferase
MGNRLSRIYTRTGDDGSTGLADGTRIDKDAPRIRTYGELDELNSHVGLLLTHREPVHGGPDLWACLEEIQHLLFDLGGDLCIPGRSSLQPAHVEWLEAWLDALNAGLPPLKEFVLPGGNPAAAQCHVARTAQVYRRAIDDAASGKPFDPGLLGVLENLAQRGYTDGFYVRHHSRDYQNYLRGHSESHRQQFVGEITAFDAESRTAEVLVKNKFAVGDRLELILPEGNRDWVLDRMADRHGNPLPEAPGGGWEVRIPLPVEQAERGLIARYL